MAYQAFPMDNNNNFDAVFPPLRDFGIPTVNSTPEDFSMRAPMQVTTSPSDSASQPISPSTSTSTHYPQPTRARASPSIRSSNAPQSEPSPQSPHSTSDARVKKRTLNTLAARRYRQKARDQVSTLEQLLKEAQDERDALKVRCARLEGEVDALKGLQR